MNTSGSMLRFDRPPNAWIEGLPLGNGRLGAMVMGYATRERLCLNHEAIWRQIADRTLKPVSRHVPAIRRALLNGDWEGAGKLLMEKLQPLDRASHTAMAEYQPAGDLIFEAADPQPVEEYERLLDLARGVATVRYRMGETRYERTCFVSAAQQTIVFHVAGSRPGAISGALWLEREVSPDAATQYKAAGRTVTLTAKIRDGASFEIRVTASCRGGTVRARKGVPLLEVAGADELTVHVAINVAGEARRRTPRSSGETKELLRAHETEHGRLFRRAEFRLGRPSAKRVRCTDCLIDDAFEKQPSSELFELMFGMGRYLMMAGSRTGELPLHLQGIWNRELHPPWQSDWHLDMNVQMNYWLAEVGNLGDCTRSLFDWAMAQIPDGRENARKLWGCRGIVLPIACAGGSKILPGPWVGWTGAAGWLAQHFWSHYEYTLDRGFLARQAYPFMKEVAAFYEDFLVKGSDGRYMVIPSISPENVPAERGEWAPHKMLAINATMDLAIVRELMGNLLAAAEILGKDAERCETWREILAHLPDWSVDAQGMLKEWASPENLDTPAHRHFSHLYPLFPGDAFTERTPELVKAAAKAFHAKTACGLASNAGWSYSYMALIHARLGEGDAALQSLAWLAKCAMMNNLLTIHNDWRFQGLTLYWPLGDRAFMIDAILGASAAIMEMLLQSHGGVIRVLPALPKAWREGSISGLCARGGFEIDIAWRRGVADHVQIRSRAGGACRVRWPWRQSAVRVVSAGKSVKTRVDEEGVVQFATKAGGAYSLLP